MATGQFYAISADMRKPYFVCGGLQDNGSWCGPSAKRNTVGILNSDWFRTGGGDGFYTQQDPTDWTVVYAESQDGNVSRLDLRSGRTTSIRPRGARAGGPGGPSPEAMAQMAAQLGTAAPSFASNIVPEPPAGEAFRFFWNTPTVLSPHNPSTVWVGGNRLFKSVNRGDTYTMTPDLTRNLSRFTRPIMGVAGDAPMASKHDGVATTSVLTTVAESPVVPGVVWAGSNDGNLQVSRDGGATWKNVAANVTGVPDETFVARVEPSHFDAGTCYVVFDGHRTDDHKPYVVVTKDYGETWASIAGNLPSGNANVLREDPKNRNLLYLGTEYALYVSLNGGKEWKPFMTGLPTVRIDDILVHPRDNDLIVGTHGRSIWILDDITPLQQLTDAAMAADVTLLTPRPAVAWRTDTTQSITVGGNKYFRGDNPAPGTAISYYLKSVPAGDVKITISDITGRVVREMAGTKDAGLNRVPWNLRGNPPAGGARRIRRSRRRRRAVRGRRRPRRIRRPGHRGRHVPAEALCRREGLHHEDRGGGGQLLAPPGRHLRGRSATMRAMSALSSGSWPAAGRRGTRSAQCGSSAKTRRKIGIASVSRPATTSVTACQNGSSRISGASSPAAVYSLSASSIFLTATKSSPLVACVYARWRRTSRFSSVIGSG